MDGLMEVTKRQLDLEGKQVSREAKEQICSIRKGKHASFLGRAAGKPLCFR